MSSTNTVSEANKRGKHTRPTNKIEKFQALRFVEKAEKIAKLYNTLPGADDPDADIDPEVAEKIYLPALDLTFTTYTFILEMKLYNFTLKHLSIGDAKRRERIVKQINWTKGVATNVEYGAWEDLKDYMLLVTTTLLKAAKEDCLLEQIPSMLQMLRRTNLLHHYAEAVGIDSFHGIVKDAEGFIEELVENIIEHKGLAHFMTRCMTVGDDEDERVSLTQAMKTFVQKSDKKPVDVRYLSAVSLLKPVNYEDKPGSPINALIREEKLSKARGVMNRVTRNLGEAHRGLMIVLGELKQDGDVRVEVREA